MGWCFGSILGFGLRVSSLLSGYDSRGFGVFRMFRVQGFWKFRRFEPCARNSFQCLSATLTYQNLLFCRVPINSILGFIIRTYKKVRFGSLRYTSN